MNAVRSGVECSAGCEGGRRTGTDLAMGCPPSEAFSLIGGGDLASQIYSASFPVKQIKPESLET